MTEKPENYMEYLFAAALKKCGDITDAEDLTQEVLLAAYTCLSKGKEIHNMKSWLSSVLNHKYYDSLRRKYKLPTVSLNFPAESSMSDTASFARAGLLSDVANGLISDAADIPVSVQGLSYHESWYEDEAEGTTPEQIRREVAYLAKLQREVIVRHYLQGQKVQEIANALQIPKGTVLSRLSSGREQIRKGLEHMEQYEKLSHTPERLELTGHGRFGFHDEPYSLVADDMMKQNILLLAYDKPISCVEIAKGLGIPAPYVEQAVEDLVKCELMVRSGSKVFTDFMIISPAQRLKSLDAEIAFARTHYTEIHQLMQQALNELHALAWYGTQNQREQIILDYYLLLHIFSNGIYTATRRIIPSEEVFPIRPDGGQWIAEGNRFSLDFDWDNYQVAKYSYGGERKAHWDSFLDLKSICLHVYDTQPDLNKYMHGPVKIQDDNLCKLLYLIRQDIPFHEVAFNTMFLEDIPHLTECGILCMENDKPQVAIPVISKAEYEDIDRLRLAYHHRLANLLETPFRELFPSLKLDIPAHLEGRIAEFRRYYCHAIPMAYVEQAKNRGDFLQGVDSPTPPMILVLEK